MKSLEELNAIRDREKGGMHIRNDQHDGVKVVVGMGTCGIAAGARPVLAALVEEVAKEGLEAQVVQSGCKGLCQYEPVVQVLAPGQEAVTYVKMTREKAVRVVQEHLRDGKPVAEYTTGAIGK